MRDMISNPTDFGKETSVVPEFLMASISWINHKPNAFPNLGPIIPRQAVAEFGAVEVLHGCDRAWYILLPDKDERGSR